VLAIGSGRVTVPLKFQAPALGALFIPPNTSYSKCIQSCRDHISPDIDMFSVYTVIIPPDNWPAAREA